MDSYTNNIDKIIEQESIHIGKGKDERRLGLSISGGGIRSASFAMGVLQALVADKQLEKIDYLSTVSGGGYLGSSLTWFLSQKMDNGKHYGTKAETFPFGRKSQGSNHAILDFIRQHGNYLAPGHGLNTLSLVTTILRTMLVSLAVYFMLATSIICLALNLMTEQKFFSACLYSLSALAILWLSTAALYSVSSFFNLVRYQLSIFIQKWLAVIANLMIILLVLSALPFLHDSVPQILHKLLALDIDSISTRTHAYTTLFSISLGSVLAFFIQRKQMQPGNQKTSSLQIIITAIFLIFGLFYGAYASGVYINQHHPGWVYPLIASALLFGLVCNINYFGLNRMYRNRLMETFMPDKKSIKKQQWTPAIKANNTKMQDMCHAPNQRPYHLINCNIVLNDSSHVKYRSRMGDSFTLSPLYCGSDATGWRRTKDYMHNWLHSELTLPTAMAISGAAANPNAGVAGHGVTTNKFVASLMSLLNLRLGFWADNPKTDKSWFPPNYIYPGFKGGVSLSGGLNENDRAIELSDGGHFENLALYEAFRRRLDIIIVSDAGADGDYHFSDLGNAVEKARVDFGVDVAFLDNYPFEAIIPDADINQSEVDKQHYHFSTRGFAIARIDYPGTDENQTRKTGHLIYLKPTLINGLSPDVLSYKKQNPTFPHQSTLDQFFTEQQFEAYRELGYSLTHQMLNDQEVRNLL